jgi:hypothetical protein
MVAHHAGSGPRLIVAGLVTLAASVFVLFAAARGNARTWFAHADSHPRSSYVITPARSIGPVHLGETRGSVAAAIGIPQLDGGVWYYKAPACIFVKYGADSKVLAMAIAEHACNHPFISSRYQTSGAHPFGIGDSFNSFATHFPHRSCTSGTTNVTHGNQTQTLGYHSCVVTGNHGNRTVFFFIAPITEVPDVYEIVVESKTEALPYACGGGASIHLCW